MLRNSCTIWTADKIIIATDEMGGWVIKEVPNLFGKIPVVYADVFQPEWDEVAGIMDARKCVYPVWPTLTTTLRNQS